MSASTYQQIPFFLLWGQTPWKDPRANSRFVYGVRPHGRINITEGHYGASKADFINKYVIAEKEAGETLYWLRLLAKSGYLEDSPATQSLLADCDELIRLLASSIKTARSKT